MNESEDRKRREYERFRRLAEAIERMQALIRGRVQFPGEGQGFPDPLEAEAVADLRAARAEAEAAFIEWHRLYAAREA